MQKIELLNQTREKEEKYPTCEAAVPSREGLRPL